MSIAIALAVLSFPFPIVDGDSPPRCGRTGAPNGDRIDIVPIIGPIRFVKDPELQVGGFGEGPNQLAGADTVKVDRRGRIHVIDDGQNLIKVYPSRTCTGEVIEIIDSSTTIAAGFGPLGDLQAITVDRAFANWGPRRLLICDRDTDRDPEIRILQRIGGQGGTWSQLAFTEFTERPNDMIVDTWGRIIVAEKNGAIDVLKPDGSGKSNSFGTAGTLVLDTFDGLEVDDFKAIDLNYFGRIFVTDKDNGRILAISPIGNPLFSIGSQGEGDDQFREQVEGCAVDRYGFIYGRDESGDRFLVFDPNGNFLTSFGERGFDSKQQENSDEFFIDKRRGRIYLADDGNYRVSVHKLLPGTFWSNILTEYDFPEAPIVDPIWIAGGTQGSAQGTEFDEPNELGFDAQGRVWAGDVFNLRLQVFDATGTFVAEVGGAGAGPGQFLDAPSGKSGPEAIKLDSQGRMFVVDRGGQRVNVYNGNDFTVIGSFTSPDIVLDDPTGMAIDASDNIYIADQGTDRVHKFSFDGTQLNLLMTFDDTDGSESILSKTETLALDEARDLLFASSEDESRAEVFVLSTGAYLDEHVGERQVGVIAQDGRFADDIEGLDTDVVNQLLFMSDEANGRFLVHDLMSSDLFDDGENFAFLGAFGKVGGAPGEFLSADGVAVSPSQDLVIVADQGNYRIQAFRISDVLAAFQ